MDRTNLAPVPAPGAREASKPTPGSDIAAQAGTDAHTTTPSIARASRREMRELRSGAIRPQRTVDLHGFRRDEAHRHLCNELARARSRGLRCILVIHGKGQRSPTGEAVLRSALDDWLGRTPLVEQVIGSCRAQPRDGGSGATYLLLRPTGKPEPTR